MSVTSENRKHQQRTAAGGHIDPPGGEVFSLVRIAGLAGKADIDMPARVTRIIRTRKSHWKAAKAVARPPSSLTNETVESRVQDWHIYRRPERRLLVVTEPDDRFPPRCRVVRIQPLDLAAMKLARL